MSLRVNTFRLVVLVLCLSALATAPGRADGPGPGGLAAELRSIYRSQTHEGAFEWAGVSRFYEQYPVAASFCLDVHRTQPNAALVSQSASAIGRYYGHLFETSDRDHDLLVETMSDGALVEDVGFNALLALDLASLASLYLEIRRPYEALYWYNGSRALQDAVVRDGFDADAGYFFPRSAGDDQSTGRYHALSALPLLFPGRVGDNHAGAIVREYLTNAVARAPESPYLFLAGPTTAQSDGVTAAGRVLKTLMLLRVLEERGFREDAETFRAQAIGRAEAELASLVEAGVTPAGHHYHVIGLIGGDDPLHEPYVGLDVFADVLLAVRAMEDIELVRLQSGAQAVRRFLKADTRGQATPSDINLAETAVRSMYMGVSAAREKLEAKELLPSSAYRSINIADPRGAVAGLLDDVVATLRLAEQRLFEHRFADLGLRAVATLMSERAIARDEVQVKWTLGADNSSVTIRSAAASSGVDRTVLVDEDAPVTLVPGESQVFHSSFHVESNYIDTLEPVALTLDMILDDNTHVRTHAIRSLYVEHPVDVSATFPRGRILTTGTAPIDVHVDKRMDSPAVIRFEWYSPAGLVLSEGRSGEYAMEEGEDSVSLALNVVVPTPCRPGRFPVRLKFYANGTDLGTIATSMFKPYQWVFAGDFPATADPATTRYPPEEGVRVLDVYEVAGRRVGWKALSDRSYNQRGEVTLQNAMTGKGVGYLFTIIESHYDATLPVFIAATSPAELFVNGQSVVRVGASAMTAPKYARVPLVSGPNQVLIKVVGDPRTRVFFNLGDENDESTYSIANDLTESLDGYVTLQNRMQGADQLPGEAQKLITLRYHAPDARAVSVVGSFNGWSAEHSRMSRLRDGHWEIVLSLPPGRYAYRFLIDERQQVLDPNSPLAEPDGYGGENSIMVVE
jgi:hypothetical protein